jgi:beta-phosphoglucomutase-like phosphatase (HAD superfamily)
LLKKSSSTASYLRQSSLRWRGTSRLQPRRARAGSRSGVGTAGDRHNIAFAFGHLKLAVSPDAVAGGDEGLAGKPEPAIFLEVARRMNVPPERCIVFEDAPFGIEAARRAGMRAVAICTGHTPEQLAGPHVLAAARNYHELIDSKFLETLNVAPA